MVKLFNTCCFYDGTKIQFIFDVVPLEDGDNFSTTINSSMRIVENGRIYPHTGNIATGVPAIQDSHFYYPLPGI